MFLCNFFLVVQPGQQAWKEIYDAFGNEVFFEDGQLNREALGKIIFSDFNRRKVLNKITHPKIQRLMFWDVLKYFKNGKYLSKLDISLHYLIYLNIDLRSQICCT